MPCGILFLSVPSMVFSVIAVILSQIQSLLLMSLNVIVSKFRRRTVFPLYTQGTTLRKRSFATPVNANKLHHPTTYDTFNESVLLVDNLNRCDHYCLKCGQLLSVLFPLSSPVKNKRICLGCCRLVLD